ncbi:hypothetical protein [Fontivita pretiosa]|uniref:hypothetical protein n=1 Tax=Fontivita pretiosa TaxID=2989684 RepID=UPI003D17CE6A
MGTQIDQRNIDTRQLIARHRQQRCERSWFEMNGDGGGRVRGTDGDHTSGSGYPHSTTEDTSDEKCLATRRDTHFIRPCVGLIELTALAFRLTHENPTCYMAYTRTNGRGNVKLGRVGGLLPKT